MVILALPDSLIRKLAPGIVPRLRSGAMIVCLDPAAPQAGVLHRRDDSQQQREIDADVEPLGLTVSETVGDGDKHLPGGQQVVETFLQPEVGEVVRADLVAEESGELFMLFDKAVIPAGPEYMVAMLDLLQGGVQFAPRQLRQPDAEDLRDLVCRQVPETNHSSPGVRAGRTSDPARVTVQIAGGLEGEEASHAHQHRWQHLVADVEVVVSEAGYFGMLERKVLPCSMLLKMK